MQVGRKKEGDEKIFLYFPVFSLIFLVALAISGVKGEYMLDEASSDLMFWSFFFIFLLLPLAFQVVWLRRYYNIAQTFPFIIAFGGYALYYVLGDWLQFLFFIVAAVLGMWINIIGKKKSGWER